MVRANNIFSSSVRYVRTHCTREIIFYLVLALIAFIMRLWQLGERTVHYDENIHFGCGQNIFHNPFPLCYDPFVHGPFQFIGTGIIYNIAGESTFTARLLPAIFGVAIVILPYFLRRQLGRWGALAMSVLLAFSPFLMYYSRYGRGDIYHAFFTLLLVVCIWNYISDNRQRWLYIGAAALSLDFCTLETTYINLAIIVFFLILLAGFSILKNLILMKDKKLRIRQVIGRFRSLATLKSVASKNDWALRIRRIIHRLRSLSPQAEVLLLLGTLTLPLFAAFINLFLGKHPINDLSNPWAIGIVVFFFIVSAALGLLWNQKRWLISAAIFYGIFIMVWSVFFTHTHGIAVGLWGDATYWIGQHGVARGGQPWFYYLMLIPIYEFLPLLFAFAGAIYYAIKGNLFSRFLIYWFVMSFIVYSVFGEKMPWISLNMVLPIIALGGMFIGFLLKGAQRKRNLRIAIRSCVAIIIIWLFSFTAYTACRESYQVEDKPSQMLFYAGMSADVPRIAAKIDAVAQKTGEGFNLSITFDNDIVGWLDQGTVGHLMPAYDSGWYWYLRDYTNVDRQDCSSINSVPRGSVLILEVGHVPADSQYLEKYGEGERFKYLIWPPEDYKSGFNLKWWWNYFLNREANDYLMREAIIYFPKGS
jgi:uncharacterized protein (TIGR03663 family)